MSNDKFCVECKHLNKDGWSINKCIHPKVSSRSLITGKLFSSPCTEVRFNPKLCGRGGRYWEPSLRFRIKTYLKQLLESWSTKCFKR